MHLTDERMFWKVEVPRAKVTGAIISGEKVMPFNGEGYHDHNWFNGFDIKDTDNNREVLSTLLKGWKFGRFFGDRLGCVYGFNDKERHLLTYKDGHLAGSYDSFHIGSEGSTMHERLGYFYPNSLTLASDNFLLQVRPSVILTDNILTIDGNGKVESAYIRFLSEGTLQTGDIVETNKGLSEIWF